MAQASYNHGQKSWNKFALLALLRTGQTKIQPLLPNFASIQCWQLLPWISSEFLLLMTSEYILFIRWGGGTVTRFLLKRKQRFFQTSLVKLRKCPKDLCSRLYMRTGLIRETSSRCTFLFPSHSLLLVSCFLFCAGRLWSLMNHLIAKGQWKDHEAHLESNQLVCTCLHDHFGKMPQHVRALDYNKRLGEFGSWTNNLFWGLCLRAKLADLALLQQGQD